MLILSCTLLKVWFIYNFKDNILYLKYQIKNDM